MGVEDVMRKFRIKHVPMQDLNGALMGGVMICLERAALIHIHYQCRWLNNGAILQALDGIEDVSRSTLVNASKWKLSGDMRAFLLATTMLEINEQAKRISDSMAHNVVQHVTIGMLSANATRWIYNLIRKTKAFKEIGQVMDEVVSDAEKYRERPHGGVYKPKALVVDEAHPDLGFSFLVPGKPGEA